MGHAEPDIAELFAPLRPAQASDVVLSEARQVLSHVQQPIDAELWGSDMIGALSGDWSDGTDVMTELAGSLVPAAEAQATPEALGLLRVLGAIGSAELKSAATEAAERVIAHGVPDPDWAAVIGSPTIGQCWHYSDIGGRQESITVSFGYGTAEHALSVLIDHGKGGKIKDAWVDDADGTFRGGYYMDTSKNGDGCSYHTTAHDFTYHDYSTGFRCCMDPERVE